MTNTIKESKKSIVTARIVDHYEVARNHFLMSLKVPSYFQAAVPGQFVMMRVKGREDPFLPRPFSINFLNSHNTGTIMGILYKVIGKGTTIFSRLKKDDELSVMGPLGNGFNMPPDRKKIALVAGGVGVAPLSFLAEYLKRQTNASAQGIEEIVCFLGASTSQLLLDRGRLADACSKLMISTDDGSDGYHGTVTELFQNHIDSYTDNDSIVFCCGPDPMMTGVAGIVKKYSIPCQVSMEERMACGVGACLGCAVRVKSHGDRPRYMTVCKDGPVFDSKDIIWKQA
ncbi:MAG: dihydroorotate dehydrogenase electron transfer subunit [Deltaproteobacteria bacterium]|nr:dihydroorotate dehydrogenase electron transfer subunit [Deltaproteobacteria bacterium]